MNLLITDKHFLRKNYFIALQQKDENLLIPILCKNYGKIK